MTVYYVGESEHRDPTAIADLGIGRGDNPSNTRPFPPGFRMVSGDSTARSYNNITRTYMGTRPVADRYKANLSDGTHDQDANGR